jgi:prephenate dehydrogenase
MVLRKKRLVKEVIGIDTDATTLTKALHRDVVDQAVGDLEQGLSQADLVVLAVPTHSTSDVMADIASHLQVGAVVCDVGRIKGPVLEKAAEVLAEENPFVGCHPVVFEEEKDIDEAYPALFQGRPCILTSGDRRDEEAVKRIREIWEGVGCKVEEMDPEVHDRLFAVLEDLPVIFLSLVCKAAGQVSGYVDEIDEYSSKELKEITKLVAQVSPHAAERFWANRKPLVHVLAYYRLKLKELSEALQEGSLQDLKALL